MKKIDFGEPTKVPFGKCWIVPFDRPYITGSIVGIDPGSRYGVTIIHDTFMTILGGAFIRQRTEEEYAELAFDMMSELIVLGTNMAAIEGPSYGSPYHQAGLAHIRMGFYLGLRQRFIPTTLVAPKSARKFVFGSGKIRASEVWTTINPNAADSVAIAMYAAGITYDIQGDLK